MRIFRYQSLDISSENRNRLLDKHFAGWLFTCPFLSVPKKGFLEYYSIISIKYIKYCVGFVISCFCLSHIAVTLTIFIKTCLLIRKSADKSIHNKGFHLLQIVKNYREIKYKKYNWDLFRSTHTLNQVKASKTALKSFFNRDFEHSEEMKDQFLYYLLGNKPLNKEGQDRYQIDKENLMNNVFKHYKLFIQEKYKYIINSTSGEKNGLYSRLKNSLLNHYEDVYEVYKELKAQNLIDFEVDEAESLFFQQISAYFYLYHLFINKDDEKFERIFITIMNQRFLPFFNMFSNKTGFPKNPIFNSFDTFLLPLYFSIITAILIQFFLMFSSGQNPWAGSIQNVLFRYTDLPLPLMALTDLCCLMLFWFIYKYGIIPLYHLMGLNIFQLISLNKVLFLSFLLFIVNEAMFPLVRLSGAISWFSAEHLLFLILTLLLVSILISYFNNQTGSRVYPEHLVKNSAFISIICMGMFIIVQIFFIGPRNEQYEEKKDLFQSFYPGVLFYTRYSGEGYFLFTQAQITAGSNRIISNYHFSSKYSEDLKSWDLWTRDLNSEPWLSNPSNLKSRLYISMIDRFKDSQPIQELFHEFFISYCADILRFHNIGYRVKTGNNSYSIIEFNITEKSLDEMIGIYIIDKLKSGLLSDLNAMSFRIEALKVLSDSGSIDQKTAQYYNQRTNELFGPASNLAYMDYIKTRVFEEQKLFTDLEYFKHSGFITYLRNYRERALQISNQADQEYGILLKIYRDQANFMKKKVKSVENRIVSNDLVKLYREGYALYLKTNTPDAYLKISNSVSAEIKPQKYEEYLQTRFIDFLDQKDAVIRNLFYKEMLSLINQSGLNYPYLKRLESQEKEYFSQIVQASKIGPSIFPRDFFTLFIFISVNFLIILFIFKRTELLSSGLSNIFWISLVSASLLTILNCDLQAIWQTQYQYLFLVRLVLTGLYISLTIFYRARLKRVSNYYLY